MCARLQAQHCCGSNSLSHPIAATEQPQNLEYVQEEIYHIKIPARVRERGRHIRGMK